MSDVQTLLARCREFGAELLPTAEGKLKVRAPAPLPEALRDELKQRKAEVLALLQRQQRALYHQAAETVREDCFAIDPCWLIDQHPDLWERMVTLDEELLSITKVR